MDLDSPFDQLHHGRVSQRQHGCWVNQERSLPTTSEDIALQVAIGCRLVKHTSCGLCQRRDGRRREEACHTAHSAPRARGCKRDRRVAWQHHKPVSFQSPPQLLGVRSLRHRTPSRFSLLGVLTICLPRTAIESPEALEARQALRPSISREVELPQQRPACPVACSW